MNVLALTVVNMDLPWMCHVLLAVLFAVLLDRGRLKPLLTVPLSAILSVFGVWVLQVVSLNGRHWFDAWVYWDQLFDGINPIKLKSDPVESIATLAFGWLQPLVTATGTIWFRRKSWARDDASGDQPK